MLDTGLADRTVLITGSAQGLGAALVRAFHAEGAYVAALDVDEEGNRALAAGLDPDGDRILPVRADLRDPAAIESAHQLVDAWRPVDVLVNNAARPLTTSLWEITPEQWDEVFAVNLRAAFLLTRSVAAGMRDRGFGRIVNMASVAGQTPRPTGAAYGSSKAGLIALTRVFAAELAPYGVTVNAVSPAMIDTPMVRSVGAEALAELTAQVPLGRIATPEEVARVAVFLASRTSFVTGATYDVNGGALMR
ncbi:SDR family NAD(P)-dependent oxidoreductase [Streptomyces pinistramenti]|uniref:SDR family NAD(P)-dependent oxidoreductase n=1 Tax=Streptomyces pinistramenti TaxID=2884812 RepID=UPI001D092C08|nr:SDR family NAD(P)-dependent oxidoreductase [Streptomyces pinistramenti]MCB5907295.1 SDR family oxidoreductase [Streptomyces pinistramenti]